MTTTMTQAQQAYDYRAEPEGDERDEIEEAITRAEETLGRAERALAKGDNEAARDLLRAAIIELEVEATQAAE